MSPSRCALLAAALAAVSSAVIADEPETNRSAARATNQQDARAVQPTPAPVRPALAQPPTPGLMGRIHQETIVAPAAPPAPKAIPTPNPGTWGIVSSGEGGGGIFRDTDSEAEAWLGADEVGVWGFGSYAGARFSSVSSWASVALFDYGIVTHGSFEGGHFEGGIFGINASGSTAGGQFVAIGATGLALVATGDIGIVASGSEEGGLFVEDSLGAMTKVAVGNYGIDAMGAEMGGYFHVDGGSGSAHVAVGDRGIEASGNDMGGYFENLSAECSVEVAAWDTGIYSVCPEYGGFFANTAATGSAFLAGPGWGITAKGGDYGGVFRGPGSSGYANVGTADRGIEAYGPEMGGYFEDTDGTGTANVGYGNLGIHASGSQMGGSFEDTDGTAYVYVGWETTGILGRGDAAGGVFEDKDGTGYLKAGYGDRGVEAGGSDMGGYFRDSAGSGFAYLGWDDTGVFGRGNVAGAVFEDADNSGYARAGFGDRGVEAGGSETGGYFEDSDGTGLAYIGIGNTGVLGRGDAAGGVFEDTDGGNWGRVGHDIYKTFGTGTPAFVQNHPFDAEAVVVYSAPEGDEVATYTRGTAKLVGGEARVPLGDTFRWVTNPVIGLTAYLTPVGDWCDLYVTEKDTEQIVVRSRDGSDCAFDYLVYGLRIGFEEVTIVQEKPREAYIPSMKSHRERAASSAELARHTALARWTATRKALGDEEPVDLSRAHALRDLIQEYDPAVHGPIGDRPPAERTIADSSREATPGASVGSSEEAHADRPSTERRAVGQFAGIPRSDPGRDVYARSFRPSAADLASLLEVSEPVEPGDVVVLDRDYPGMMRRADIAADPTVVGVVAASPGVVLGSSDTGAGIEAAVAFAGVASCKVDAEYGPVYPGDLLVTSPTPGHAMRADVPQPGTVLGKALEELPTGSGVIRVLVILR